MLLQLVSYAHVSAAACCVPALVQGLVLGLGYWHLGDFERGLPLQALVLPLLSRQERVLLQGLLQALLLPLLLRQERVLLQGLLQALLLPLLLVLQLVVLLLLPLLPLLVKLKQVLQQVLPAPLLPPVAAAVP